MSHSRLCVCGHPYSAHQHYRRGTECSLCPDCPRWRRDFGPITRAVKGLIVSAKLAWPTNR